MLGHKVGVGDDPKPPPGVMECRNFFIGDAKMVCQDGGDGLRDSFSWRHSFGRGDGSGWRDQSAWRVTGLRLAWRQPRRRQTAGGEKHPNHKKTKNQRKGKLFHTFSLPNKNKNFLHLYIPFKQKTTAPTKAILRKKVPTQVETAGSKSHG
jgi:hypothetical protein